MEEVCPGCGVKLTSRNLGLNNRYNASGECYEKFNELTAYNFFKNDQNYIHQIALNAYVAQHSGGPTKNLNTVSALIGLYLYVVKEFTGEEIQLLQMKIPKAKYEWSLLEIPSNINEITVLDVLNESSVGDKREQMIKKWAIYVWKCWSHEEDWIARVVEKNI